jgi:hypothetical protein
MNLGSVAPFTRGIVSLAASIFSADALPALSRQNGYQTCCLIRLWTATLLSHEMAAAVPASKGSRKVLKERAPFKRSFDPVRVLGEGDALCDPRG